MGQMAVLPLRNGQERNPIPRAANSKKRNSLAERCTEKHKESGKTGKAKNVFFLLSCFPYPFSFDVYCKRLKSNKKT
jgi:hypothetical protein